MARRKRDGVTLVELLVGIAIFSVLMAITLPAVQASRESSRLTSCRGNIVQLASAFQQFETYFGHYPSGGWSPQWVGVAERQGDASQPGGWAYSVLPYMEGKDTRNSVANVTASNAAEAYTRLVTSSLPNFNCPTRRTAQPLTVTSSNATYQTGIGPVTIARATRTDYAVNSGSVESCPPLSTMAAAAATAADGNNKNKRVTICHAPPGRPDRGNTMSLPISALNGHMNHPGDRFGSCTSCAEPVVADTPSSLSIGDVWSKMSAAERMAELTDMGIPDVQNGLAGRMSTPRAASVSDGLSNTYLVGEKNVASNAYFNGTDPGDTRPLAAGYSSSNVRWGYVPPAPDSAESNPAAFGSGHRAGWNMAYGDGSVRTISFSIDPTLHARLSNRNDGPGVIAIPPN
jgi:prepilin-type N-terminal cleavage/methylation domain-containing protein